MMTYDFRFKTNDAVSRHLQTEHKCAFRNKHFVLENHLAGEEGLEPSHAGIKIQCLNQLGDSPTQVKSFTAADR